MIQTHLTPRRFVLLGAFLMVVVAIASAVPGCRRSGSTAPRKGDGVVVTIFPLYDLVRQVAGPEIRVSLLLPPGVSEHGYTPSPADVKALNDAAILVANGGGIDDWIASAYKDRARSGQRLVHFMSLLGHDLGAFDSASGHDHDHDHDHMDHGESEADRHDHSGPNPHVWLVPAHASKLVKKVAAELAALYPEHAAALNERETEVQESLAALDVAYEEALEGIVDRRLITYHDAFGPLAERYGLVVVATVLDMETHDVTPARLAAVRRHVEEEGVRAVFIEPQFTAAAAEGLARRATLRLLDPLGDPGRQGYETYDALMRSNLDNLVKGLRENVRAVGSGG